MTTPNRRQIMAGSIAALGAAGAPAIAEAKAPPVERSILDHLPFELQMLAFFKWLRTEPVADRERFMAELEAGNVFEPDALAFMRRFVDLPA